MTVIARDFPERVQIGRWDNGRFAGPFDADMKNGRPDLTTAVYVRADLHAGAVGAIGDAIQLLQGCRDGDAVDARALLKAAHAKFGALSSPSSDLTKEDR